MPNSLNFSTSELGPSRTSSRSKTFPELHMLFRVSCGNPESQCGTVLGSKVDDWECGTLQSCSLFQDRKKKLVSDNELTWFCNSWIWVKSWLTVAGSLFWCIDSSTTLACLARSVSSQQILRKSSISWKSFARFTRKSLFLISNSPHKFIFSLWAWWAHRFACCRCNRWDSSSLRISKEQYQNFSLSNFWSPFLLQLRFVFFWSEFSPWAGNSAFRSSNLWIFCLSFSVFISFNKCLSLGPRHRFFNTHNSFVARVRCQFPGAGEWGCNRIVICCHFPGACRT